MSLSIAALGLLAVAACSSEIYLRDGVTDGDTFYLSPQALGSDDPVRQSWIRYSLIKSSCQLQIGGENPARASSCDCELTARRQLADAWHDIKLQQPDSKDVYLDQLSLVQSAGYLAEYTVEHFREDNWQLPAGLDMPGYRRWARSAIPAHTPETRIIGSWNFSERNSSD